MRIVILFFLIFCARVAVLAMLGGAGLWHDVRFSITQTLTTDIGVDVADVSMVNRHGNVDLCFSNETQWETKCGFITQAGQNRVFTLDGREQDLQGIDNAEQWTMDTSYVLRQQDDEDYGMVCSISATRNMSEDGDCNNMNDQLKCFFTNHMNPLSQSGRNEVSTNIERRDEYLGPNTELHALVDDNDNVLACYYAKTCGDNTCKIVCKRWDTLWGVLLASLEVWNPQNPENCPEEGKYFHFEIFKLSQDHLGLVIMSNTGNVEFVSYSINDQNGTSNDMLPYHWNSDPWSLPGIVSGGSAFILGQDVHIKDMAFARTSNHNVFIVCTFLSCSTSHLSTSLILSNDDRLHGLY